MPLRRRVGRIDLDRKLELSRFDLHRVADQRLGVLAVPGRGAVHGGDRQPMSSISSVTGRPTPRIEAGWPGRKSGRGFYDYRGETPVPTR